MHYEVDIPELETERLILRGLRLNDVQPLHEMCSDEETMRHLGGVRSLSMTSQNHASMIGHWVLLGYGMWAVVEKATGAFVGRVGLINFDGWPQVEVGWLIGRPWWGRGYAPEAARASAHWAFQNLNLNSLCSLIALANQNSQRVADKIGETPVEQVQMFNTDITIYRMTREKFYDFNKSWYTEG